MSGLFHYPVQAKVDRVIPKAKIYQYGKINKILRSCFIQQVEKIIWQYKLAPETINLPARPGVPEIQIFEIFVKTQQYNPQLVQTIDQAIPLPVLYHINFEDRVKFCATYKRPHEADAEKWVMYEYYQTPWQIITAERAALPVALDLSGLYSQMLRSILPRPPKVGESLKDHVERLSRIRGKEQECHNIQIRLRKEKQFNRKVELNTELRQLKTELATLTE